MKKTNKNAENSEFLDKKSSWFFNTICMFAIQAYIDKYLKKNIST